MGTLRTSIEIFNGVSGPMAKIRKSVDTAVEGFKALHTATKTAVNTSTIQRASNEIIKIDSAVDQIDQSIIRSGISQQQLNNGMRDGVSAASGLLNKIKNIAMTMGVAFGAQKIISLADGMTSTTARLNLMNDGLQTTAELQKMIMRSANESRAYYSDTAAVVGKLGIMAKGAFDSTEQIVEFAELMNKQFVIGGVSVQEQTAAMYQLTQAMAAGKLQGDEFRSILENAPMLAQSIADYMGLTTGELKEIASEGLITAEVIKNAMFAAADQTNAAFNQIPMTFSQVGTLVANTLLQAFQPVIQMIGAGAQWIYDNWSTLEPIFYGLAAAVGAYAVALGIMRVATLIQTIAQWGLNAALMANPIMWIALAIGVVIGLIYKWVQSVGGLKVAWLIVVNALLKAWDWVKIAFFTGVYWVIDLWDKMKLAFMKVGFAITSFMGDMKVGVLTILQNLINGAIDIINGFIELLNKIPGVNIDLIGKVSFATTAAAENEAAKQAGQAAIDQYETDITAAAQERDNKLAQMQADAAANAAARQVEIDAAKADAATAGASDTAQETAAYSGETAANTASIADSMDAMDENLQYMRDIAERDVINRFTTAEIKIEQTNNNNIGSDMDIDGIMNKWNEDFIQILETSAEGVA
jgi:tape measure domain-containing protein